MVIKMEQNVLKLNHTLFFFCELNLLISKEVQALSPSKALNKIQPSVSPTSSITTCATAYSLLWEMER